MEQSTVATTTWENNKVGIKVQARKIARLWMILLLGLADLSGLAVAVWLSSLLHFGFVNFMLPATNQSINVWLLLVLFLFMNQIVGLYPGVGLSPVTEMQLVAKATTFSFLVITLTNIATATSPVGLHPVLLVDWTLSLITIQSARWLVRILAVRFGVWGESVAVLGWGRESCWAVDYFLNRNRLGIIPIVFVDLDDCPHENCNAVCFHLARNPNLIKNYFAQRGIQTAVVVKDALHERGLQKAIEDQRLEFSRYILIPNVRGVGSFGVVLHDLEGLFGMEVRNNLASPYYRVAKRLLDYFLIAAGSIFILPLCALIAFLIRLDSPGSPFYSHPRVGKNGQPINVWKFRSMVLNADTILHDHLVGHEDAQLEWQQTQKLKHDPRVTRVGRFLRRTSLDELPQLWNVIKGEMSLVGPRPVMQEELERYGEGKNQYLSVRPGLTGLWQVSGRNNTSYDERIQFDEYYARNWSIWLDIYILCRTIWVVLNREGAY